MYVLIYFNIGESHQQWPWLVQWPLVEYSLAKRTLLAPSFVCVLKYVTSTRRAEYFQLNGRFRRNRCDIEIWYKKFFIRVTFRVNHSKLVSVSVTLLHASKDVLL